jgi:hypothetical protein
MRTTPPAAPREARGPMTAAPILHAMAVPIRHATALPSPTLLRQPSVKTSGSKRPASTVASTTSKRSPAEVAPRYRSAANTASCPRSVALGAAGRTAFAIATPSLLAEGTRIAPPLWIVVAAPHRLPAAIRGRRRLNALPMPNVRRSPMVDASRPRTRRHLLLSHRSLRKRVSRCEYRYEDCDRRRPPRARPVVRATS